MTYTKLCWSNIENNSAVIVAGRIQRRIFHLRGCFFEHPKQIRHNRIKILTLVITVTAVTVSRDRLPCSAVAVVTLCANLASACDEHRRHRRGRRQAVGSRSRRGGHIAGFSGRASGRASAVCCVERAESAPRARAPLAQAVATPA